MGDCNGSKTHVETRFGGRKCIEQSDVGGLRVLADDAIIKNKLMKMIILFSDSIDAEQLR